MDKVKLRCSQLPKFMKCPSSAIPVRNPIIEPEPGFNDPAKLGTAVHSLLQAHIEGKADIDVGENARFWNVDADDLGQLFSYGIKCWGLMAEHFGEHPVCEEFFEREFPTFTLTGHPDVKSDPEMEGDRATADHKSGRVEYDARWQLFGGSLGGGERRGVIVWLRETWTGEPFEVVEIPPEAEIIKQLTAQVEKMHAGECVTGPHCLSMYCERRHECEAYQTQVANAHGQLLTLDESETLPAVEVVQRGYYPWKELKALLGRFEALMNETLDAQGDVDLGNGKKLTRMTTHPKEFDAAKTLPVMADYGIENPAELFKVAGTKLAKAIKETAADAGAKKGAHLAAFYQDCEDAGAMKYGERKQRKEVRCAK